MEMYSDDASLEGLGDRVVLRILSDPPTNIPQPCMAKVAATLNMALMKTCWPGLSRIQMRTMIVSQDFVHLVKL